MSKKTYSIFGSRMSTTKMVEFVLASLNWIDDYEDDRQCMYELLGFQISCWTNKHSTNEGNNGASDVIQHLQLDLPETRAGRTKAEWRRMLEELCCD